MTDAPPQAGRTSAPTTVPDGEVRQGPFARLSLDKKLPLMMAALLLLVVVAISVASYVEVRATSTRIAVERLVSLTTQFRDAFQLSSAQLRGTTAAVGSKAGVVAFAKTRNTRDRARALADLKYAGANPDQVRATELRDARGRVLLSTAPKAGFDTMGVGDVLPRNEPGDSAVIGAFRLLRDTIVFATSSPVKGNDRVYVVRWRRVVGSRRGREGITNLMGSQAAMYFGSPGGAHWTDLERPVPPPPFNPAAPQLVQTYKRDGTQYLAGVAHIAGTPWTVAIDVPMTAVLGPVDIFVRRIALIALVALAIALAGAWMVSRRLTRPLLQLTDAAAGITGGDFSRAVNIKRADELGRLGKAFTAMASEVKHTRDNLERRVDERTRDLNDTLKQLHDAQGTLVRREKLAVLGQLASGVGHELRNPLGVMTNAVYYLKMVLEGQPRNVHEYLDMLQQQITLSEKIVADLLDFTRSKPPKRAATSLTDVASQQVVRLGSPEGVQIDSNLNGQLPPVLVDQSQLAQIILNLLTNAVQAIEGKGLIRVRGLVSGERVIYEVEDSGPGVPPENFEKVFEPLFTTKARGIGLGLAVSRTLARANGGDITVTNAMGGGALFRLSLPIAVSGSGPAGAGAS